MIFIGGILTGILLSIIAVISGQKIGKEIDTYEREHATPQAQKKMATIIKMQNAVKKLLEDE